MIQRALASSLRLAQDALKPAKGEQVLSAASRALGDPRPLADGVCRGCGQRPRAHPKTPYCEPCAAAVHRTRSERNRARNEAPLPPAVAIELRAALAKSMETSSKGGRPKASGQKPRGPTISISRREA